MSSFIFLWVVYLFTLFISSQYLLITLILLEFGVFIILMTASYLMLSFSLSSFMILILFIMFVMEGVIGMCGLVLLVSFSGSDYVSSSALSL